MPRITRLIKFSYSESLIAYYYEFDFETDDPEIFGGGILSIDKLLKLNDIQGHVHGWLMSIHERNQHYLSREEHIILFDASRCAVPEGLR